MNNTILGILTLFIFASPLIALIVIIVLRVTGKIHPPREKTQNEKQPKSMLEQHNPHKLASTPRRVFNFIAITILLILAGSFIGVAASFFSYFIYIVFVFPLVTGFAGGRFLLDAIERLKIRRTYQVALTSLLMATTIYGTYHYGRYIGLQIQTSLEMFPGLSAATEDKNLRVAKAFVDYALEQETGHAGFAGYILFRAKEGVSIGRFYHSSVLNLGPILTWFYWLLEFGIISWVMFGMGKGQSNMPFCEYCGNWYDRERHVGGTKATNETLLQNLIQQKDFVEMRRLLEPNAGLPSLEIYVQGCQRCNEGPSHLVLRRAFQSPKGEMQFADISQTILQSNDSSLLLVN